jgi:hypothetical protein
MSGTGGSIQFTGSSNSNISISNDIDIRVGSGDFTIEWFQYQTSEGSFPRVFSIGTFGSVTQAVSIERGTFYYWENSSVTNKSFSVSTGLLNTWNHFAITRSNNLLNIYRNGIKQITNVSSTFNYNNTTSVLRIGNESNTSAGSSFQGLITNFHWIKGTNKYDGLESFPVPTSPFQLETGTKILLRASTEETLLTNSSTESSLIANGTNLSFSATTPFLEGEIIVEEGGEGGGGGEEEPNVPCLHPSTMILKANGNEISITDLHPGEFIQTIYGPSRVSAVYRCSSKQDRNRPFCIRKYGFSQNLPNEDLILSPLHQCMWNGRMISSQHLSHNHPEEIIYRLPPGEYEYYSIEVENRSLIKGNGIWVNSCIRCPKEDEDY